MSIVVDGLAQLFQLALASAGKLLPGLGHLLELLAVSGRRCPRHVSAFGGVLKILVNFPQEPPRCCL